MNESEILNLPSSVLWLGSRAEVDAPRLALWGSSFSPSNPPDFMPTPQKGDGIETLKG